MGHVMTRKLLAVSVAGAFVALWGVVPAMADETGLATVLHSVRREGARLCLDGHFHYGNSSGQPTKKAAEVAAIKDWAGFTAFEYGSTWANFAKAGSKKIGCTQSSGSWGCSLEARPCK